MIDIFYFMFKPSFWIMNDSYCEILDIKINSLLDNPKNVILNEFTIEINGYSIWIKNYPYGYASIRNSRPSRKTIIRLKDFVINEHIKNGEK